MGKIVHNSPGSSLRNMKTKKVKMQNKRPSSGTRSDKRGIHVRGSWKAVELDPSLFSEEGMGGLVCFEELTDYRLVDSAKVADKDLKEPKKKAKKRKAIEVEEEEEEGGAGEEEAGDEGTAKPETSETPAKKRKKKKRKKKQKVSQEEPAEPDSAVGGEERREEKKPDQTPDEVSETVMEKTPDNVSETVTEKTPDNVSVTEKEKTPDNVSETVTEKTPDNVLVTEKTPNDVSESVAVNTAGEKEAAEESASLDVDVEKGAQPPAVTTNSADKKKKKKRRKKKKRADKPAAPEAPTEKQDPQTEIESQTTSTEPTPRGKGVKLPKQRAKNWTNASLSGYVDQKSDVGAWKDLFVPDPVLKALSSLGFGSPTAIQALALPPAIRDQMDIVGAAETGSGKTLSFGIPMIHAILEWRKGPDEAEDQPEAAPQVESLYLPSAEGGGEEGGATPHDGEEAETGAALTTGTGDGTAVPGAEETGEAEATEECDPGEEDEEGDDSDGAQEAEEEEDGRDDEGMGCVKVIEDVEFDFDDAAEEEEAQAAVHKQPLLGLVLTPTRELAVQVKHHIDAVAKFTGIRTAVVVGGMAQQKQVRMLKHRPEIIIATPGRLWEMIKEGNPHLQNLRQIRCLVIDEADRMVERGHFAELESLLEMLNTVQFNPKRQTFVFSATLTMAHSLPTRVLRKKGKKVDQRSKLELLMEKVGIRSKPKVIDLTRKEATVETLTETRIHCEKEEKDFFLYYFLLQYPGRTMVFANSIDCIKRLSSLLVILELAALPLHANMHQKNRLRNLERFAERESFVLLTTDVAARGLDIPDVQHVIHYHVPRTTETYVHRSGRTARATKEGLSLLLIGPDDMMNFRKIYRALGKDEDLPMFPVQSKCMAAIKERVNMARKIEKVEYFNSREKQHNSWFREAANALDVDLDEDLLLGGRKDEEEERQQQRMVKGMKKHLKHLLTQPVFKNEMKTKYPTQMGKLSLPHMPLAGETALTSVSIQRKKQKQKKKNATTTVTC